MILLGYLIKRSVTTDTYGRDWLLYRYFTVTLLLVNPLNQTEFQLNTRLIQTRHFIWIKRLPIEFNVVWNLLKANWIKWVSMLIEINWKIIESKLFDSLIPNHIQGNYCSAPRHSSVEFFAEQSTSPLQCVPDGDTTATACCVSLGFERKPRKDWNWRKSIHNLPKT